jgi:ubiquinone biosynthesis protein
MKRSRVDRVRESLRLQQVYNVFLRYGVDMLLDRGGLGDYRRFMQEKIYDPPQPVVHLSTPVKTRLMIQELGPTYVKMGQIVSSQAQVLPMEWDVELTKLQSEVPPFPIEQVREILVEELGEPPEDLFATFDPQPLAAASTAQVHRATLHDGQEVVVKVQRPGITTQVKADLGIMDSAARMIERRVGWARDVGLRGILEEFSTNVIAELDYTGEAYNAVRLSRNLESIEGVRIPIIYRDLSTSKVLTMEYVEGVKAIDLPAIEAAGIDRKALAEVALRSLVKQLLIDGFFHGDPHPGNVLVDLKTGDLVYLDTGMVGELDVNQRMNLIQLLVAVRQGDVKGMAQIMLGLSVPFREVDEKAYYRDFERQVGRYMEPGAAASFSGAVNVGFALLQQHGLRLDPELTLAIKTLMQVEAISSLLHPESGISVLGVDITKELLVEQVTADKVVEVITQQATLSLREVVQRLPSLQEATVKWLDQYQKGRFEVHIDTGDLSREMKSIRVMGRQVIIGVMLVGMLIGSSIAASISPLTMELIGVWEFLPRIAMIGFTASLIVSGIFILVMLWRLARGQDRD